MKKPQLLLVFATTKTKSSSILKINYKKYIKLKLKLKLK